MKLDNVRQILVLNRNHIGDCLLTTPLLRALKRRYPRARLCVSVPESNRELLETNSHVDQIIIRPEINSWASKFKFAWEIHTRGYDLIISLQEKSNFYAWATHFSAMLNRRLITVGLDHPRTRRHYQHNVPVPGGRHEVFKYLDVAELLGCPPEKNPVLELTPPPGSREKIGAWVSIEGFDPDQRFVGINPGGTKPEKRWVVERFAEVADRLHEETGLPALILGGPTDLGNAQEISAAMKTHTPLIAAARATLGDTAALLERCNLLVTGDTGPMHMAVALAVPVVALFGPTDPAKFRPFSSASVVLRHQEPCPACALGPATKSNPEPSRLPCIHTITAAEVAEAALSLYQGPMTRVTPQPR
jgi:ADP-heptose:LPS heptosyltransferase